MQHKRTGHASMGGMGDFLDMGDDGFDDESEASLGAMGAYLANQMPDYRAPSEP